MGHNTWSPLAALVGSQRQVLGSALQVRRELVLVAVQVDFREFGFRAGQRALQITELLLVPSVLGFQFHKFLQASHKELTKLYTLSLYTAGVTKHLGLQMPSKKDFIPTKPTKGTETQKVIRAPGVQGRCFIASGRQTEKQRVFWGLGRAIGKGSVVQTRRICWLFKGLN